MPSTSSSEETPEPIYNSFFKHEKMFQNIPNKYIDEEKENRTNQHERLLKSIHKQTNHQFRKKRKKVSALLMYAS